LTDLLNAGHRVTLANGDSRTLRVGMPELYQLEKRFGSLNTLLEQLQEKPFVTITEVFALVFKLTVDEALNVMDSTRLATEYAEAISNGIAEAVGSRGEATAPATAPNSQSPGSVSSTSASSSSASASPSSGDRT
jgi:hypothetical protein